MADDKYYIRWRGKITGPFGRAHLILRARAGELTRHHALSADQRSWSPAGSLDWLFDAGGVPQASSLPEVNPPVLDLPPVVPQASNLPEVNPPVPDQPPVVPQAPSLPEVNPPVPDLPPIVPQASSLPEVNPPVLDLPAVVPQASSRPEVNPPAATPPQSTPTPSETGITPEAGEVADAGKSGLIRALTIAAPWWLISAALHVLAIALIGLSTLELADKRAAAPVLVSTEFHPAPAEMAGEKKPGEEATPALQTHKDIPPTDPTAPENLAVEVPASLMSMAILGEHFETANPDLPDTGGAFGNPDAHLFYSATGDADPPGGGGNGGVDLQEVLGLGMSAGGGGGWGGGTGGGTGADVGTGKGSFGNRTDSGRKVMVKRHGGTPATEAAVERALKWLAAHQEADGHWNSQKYGGPLGMTGDAAMTGFALLAFLGAGQTESVGHYQPHVRRAMLWLVGALNAGGAEARIFCPNCYTQGIATLALAEATAMCRPQADCFAALRTAAQRAVDGVTEAQIKAGQSEFQAWDYSPLEGQRGTNDTSVTGWNIMALKSARVAGLRVNPLSCQGAMAWINAGQDLSQAPSGADGEYWTGGLMAYRGTMARPNKGDGSPALMAAAALTRLMVGGERPTAPGIAGPCNVMLQAPNLPGARLQIAGLPGLHGLAAGPAAPGNLYYLYYGTLVMFQKGGRHWETWNEALKKTLPASQRQDGDLAGSWDGDGFNAMGRVMATALGALCLEVYYRYQRVNQ